MAKYEIEFPTLVKDGVEYEPTGEWRCPNYLEWYLAPAGPRQASGDYTIEKYPILSRKPTPLENVRAAFNEAKHFGMATSEGAFALSRLGAAIADLEASK